MAQDWIQEGLRSNHSSAVVVDLLLGRAAWGKVLFLFKTSVTKVFMCVKIFWTSLKIKKEEEIKILETFGC